MGISTVKATPPDTKQIEVTLIGPGRGESALVHIGNNKWIIIDSCIDSDTSEPTALSYLRSIGIAPETSVVLIIATHWHDDHVRGISKVLSSCPNAKFCASGALSREEFLAFVLTFEEFNKIAAGSGVSELREVYRILMERRLTILPVKAAMNRKIFHSPADDSNGIEECNVWTLSPADKQIDLFLQSLTAFMPTIKTTKFRAVEPADIENELSVVTWIQIGGFSILLGADLKETTDPDTGWSVIIDSAERPQSKACIYKVSHHGSINAHNDEIWTKMLSDQAYAILTTFNQGKTKLPRSTDISRIESFTPNGYSTSNLAYSKSNIRRSATVERTIKERVGKIRRLEPPTGMVRLRRFLDESESWSVELSGSACKIKNVYSKKFK